MKPSEFAKYYKIVGADGKLQDVNWREEDLLILDVAYELGVDPYVHYRGRKRNFYEVNPIVKEEIEKIKKEVANKKQKA